MENFYNGLALYMRNKNLTVIIHTIVVKKKFHEYQKKNEDEKEVRINTIE